MNDEFLAIFWLGISVTVNIALVLAWFGQRRRLRRLETRPVDLTQLDDMMARVDSSLDGVTARLDELVSSQDFLNRVLADRLDRLGRALPAPEPHDTPV
jgi:biopolymer transport protein ExbB/TolQ